jgi:hypothetical protein
MRPKIYPETAVRLAQEHWGLQSPLHCTELDAYDDRNYRLAAKGTPNRNRNHSVKMLQPAAAATAAAFLAVLCSTFCRCR